MVVSPLEVFAWQLNFYHRAVNPFFILLSKLISGQQQFLLTNALSGDKSKVSLNLIAIGK
jgi:hypothetical protein